MTIREQFKQLKASKNVETIEKFKKKYRQVFYVNSSIVCKAIVEAIKQENPKLKVNPVRQTKNNAKLTPIQDITTTIVVKHNSDFTFIHLAEKSTACNESDFISGEYPIDVFNILMDDTLPYSKLVHSACWEAITENLKQQITNNQIK